MSFDITLHLLDNSPEAQAVGRMMHDEHVGPQEAVLRILREAAARNNPPLAGLGLFSSPEDAAALDVTVTQACDERHRPSKRGRDL